MYIYKDVLTGTPEQPAWFYLLWFCVLGTDREVVKGGRDGPH